MGLAQVLIPGSQLIPMPLGLANQGLSLRPVSPAHPMLSGSSSCLCLEGSIQARTLEWVAISFSNT